MQPSVFDKIKIDIESLDNISKTRVEAKRKHIDSERVAFEKQQNFLLQKIKRLQTKYIFIDEEEISVTIELRKSINSSRFTSLKDASNRIINQHFNEYNATHDKLTEIFNRHGLDIEIKNTSTYRTVTYCITDIDNFKQINDSHSHDHGDKVLRDLAKKLKIECAKYSSEEKKIIYARLGGEEFAILIFHENEDTKTPDLIRANINGSTEKVSYTSSLGFTSKEINGKIKKDDLAQLYKEADAALYKSKKEGKNQSTEFNQIRKTLGKVIEVDRNHKVIAIDIGKNSNITETDTFIVYPEKYSGRMQFIIDDGRSKKPIGNYPKIEIGKIRPFDIQDEISFCRFINEENCNLIEVGSRLELVEDELSQAFDEAFSEPSGD